MLRTLVRSAVLAAAVGLPPTAARADLVFVTVTAQNVSPANGISFAPLRFGFHNGTFDAFDNGQVAGSAIVSIAEGGTGQRAADPVGPGWFEAFEEAEPQAVLGSIDGALLPGQTRSSAQFLVDTDVNPFFTFGTMVVPSNDLFLGNDNPQAFRLFDAAGDLQVTQIGQSAGQIWDAGSEAFDLANAAFLPGGVNAQRTPQGGVVSFDFSELTGFNGQLTSGGYVLSNLPASNSDPVYRITFSAAAVPEPSSLLTLAAAFVGPAAVRAVRRRSARPADPAA